MIEIDQPRRDEAQPMLICAGQAVATNLADGVRILELDEELEIGRGQPEGSQVAPRFETADPHMSRAHALIRRHGAQTVVLRDLGSRNGTIVDGVRLVGERVIESGAVLFMGSHVFVYRLMSRDDLDIITAEQGRPLAPVPTLSPMMARLGRRLRRLARSDVDLLLGGETGAGKEVFAAAIHRESGRRGEFIAINCAALPESLLESELFGYARGAHSTADQSKPGLIEQAEGGTLFLDEIGEMSSNAQSKLLRFLQDRLVLPLGGTRTRRLDVRVIAATRRSITGEDQEQGVRFDLAARVGPEPLVIPPLRERPEDIGLLARYFLRDQPRAFDARAYRSLFLYRWPGNVRELEKTLRLAAVLGEGIMRIEPEHLPFEVRADGRVTDPSEPPSVNRDTLPDVVSETGTSAPRPSADVLASLLERHHGNVADVARELQRQRTLVWRWLRKAGLDPAQFRAASDSDG
jgi:DNA-binding NtrC family response regulator